MIKPPFPKQGYQILACFCRDEAKDRLMQRSSFYLYLPVSVYASIDVTTEFQDFFFRFSKVKVVILFEIEIVFRFSNIFLLV